MFRFVKYWITSHKHLIGLVSVVYVFSAFGLPGGSHDDRHLFVIARSKNANIVCYDLNKDAKGLANKERPLRVYWINKTDHPGEESPLNYIQDKFAYGYSSKVLAGGAFEISLVAFPDRKLILEPDGKNGYRARVMISGKPSLLKKIFVQAKPGNSLKVAWVDIYGIDIQTGKSLTERITPAK